MGLETNRDKVVLCAFKGSLSHIPLLVKIQQDLLGCLVGRQFRGVDGDVRVGGLDVGVVDSGDAFDLVGAMGAQMAIPPFWVISLATKPMRVMLRFRCSFEKVSSLERF